MKKKIIIVFMLFTTAFISAEWIEKAILSGESIWASSSLSETLKGKKITYGPEALFDNNITTPWVEGVEGVEGSGIGENITILTQRAVTGLTITNGFASSERLYNRNNRLKKIKLSILAGLTAPGMVSELDYYMYFVKELPIAESIIIKDTSSQQFFSISLTTEEQFDFYKSVILQFKDDNPYLFKMIEEELGITEEEAADDWNIVQIMELYGYFSLQMTIEDIYKGSHYNDTCISEIKVDTESF